MHEIGPAHAMKATRCSGSDCGHEQRTFASHSDNNNDALRKSWVDAIEKLTLHAACHSPTLSCALVFVRVCVLCCSLWEEQATLRRLPQARSLDKAHFKLAISMLGSDASYDMV